MAILSWRRDAESAVVAIAAILAFSVNISGCVWVAQQPLTNGLPSSPAVSSITISPNSASLVPNGTAQFAAAIQGTTADKSVTWKASAGTVTSSGLYIAPASAGTALVTATSNADLTKLVSATVTVTQALATVTSVTISPALASSIPGGTLPFAATVRGTTSNKTVTWKASSGTISSSGLYTAPPTAGTATVTATSNADSTKWASGPVEIIAEPAPPPPSPTPTPSTTINLPLPSTFFGQNVNLPESSHFPLVPFGGLRLWDTNTTWAEIETSNGVYSWTTLDTWLGIAETKNVDVLYTFGRVPSFISSNPTQDAENGHTGGAAFPTDIASGDGTFKAFVTALVNHSLASSSHKINYYELWNEPNIPTMWTGTTAQLVIMATDASAIIRSLDPNAKILSPPPSDCVNNQIWISGYFAAGATALQDIIACHSYLPASVNGHLNSSAITTAYANIATIAAQYKLSSKPIWFTEGSWGNDTTMTDEQQIAYLSQEYILAWSVGAERVYWYAWDNTFGTPAGNGYGTLWDPTNGVHPAGAAYGLLYDWLVDSVHPEQPCSQSFDATWICTLTLANGNSAELVWNPTASRSLTVGNTFTNYRTLDNTAVNSIVGSVVTIGDKPILLE